MPKNLDAEIAAIVSEMEDAGVDPGFISRFKAVTEASPLRAELKEAVAKAEAAIERATKAESGLLGATFKELGIKAKPSAFALPADLDKTDVGAVKAWAVDQGLIEPEPPAPEGDLAAMERIAQASTGSVGAPDTAAALLNATNEAEFWAQAESSGLTR